MSSDGKIAWPGPDATKAEIDAFYAKHAPPPDPAGGQYGLASSGQPHEAPAVENGPSLVCNACGVVRVGMLTPFCTGCRAQLQAGGVEVP